MQTIGRSADAAGKRYVGKFNKAMSFLLGAVFGSPTGGDLGVGTVNAIEVALNGYKILNESFRPAPQPTPNLTVAVAAGTLQYGSLLIKVAGQNSAALVAPVTNPRNDIVYVDANTGVIGVAPGAEAVTPLDPTLPIGKIAIARVRLTVGIASLGSSNIDDLRMAGTPPARPYITQGSPGYTVTAANNNGIVDITGGPSLPVTLPLGATVGVGFSVTIRNKIAGTFGVVTVGVTGANTIDGQLFLGLYQGDWIEVFWDGTQWRTLHGRRTSAAGSYILNNTYQLPHFLPTTPVNFGGLLIADAVPELGYAANQKVDIRSSNINGASTRAFSLYADATNINLTMGSAAVGLLNVLTNTTATTNIARWAIAVWFEY